MVVLSRADCTLTRPSASLYCNGDGNTILRHLDPSTLSVVQASRIVALYGPGVAVALASQWPRCRSGPGGPALPRLTFACLDNNNEAIAITTITNYACQTPSLWTTGWCMHRPWVCKWQRLAALQQWQVKRCPLGTVSLSDASSCMCNTFSCWPCVW